MAPGAGCRGLGALHRRTTAGTRHPLPEATQFVAQDRLYLTPAFHLKTAPPNTPRYPSPAADRQPDPPPTARSRHRPQARRARARETQTLRCHPAGHLAIPRHHRIAGRDTRLRDDGMIATLGLQRNAITG